MTLMEEKTFEITFTVKAKNTIRSTKNKEQLIEEIRQELKEKSFIHISDSLLVSTDEISSVSVEEKEETVTK
jgi:hypothetical protein